MGLAKTDVRSTEPEKWTILKLSVFAVLICDVSTWTYHIVNTKMAQAKARQLCQTNYTDMVFIRNKKESEYLNKTLPGAPYFWIGIRKEKNTWIWEENKKAIPEYMKMWAPGEPSERSNEICVELYIKRPNSSGLWNDIGCFQMRRPLCYQDSCDNSTCNLNGECIEDIGTYTCECWPGFHGNNCEHAVSCGDLQIPANGKIDCVDEYGKFQYKSFCIFTCNKGYTLNGMKSLFCQNTGEWSEPTPTCLAVRCADPQIPENGKISCTHKDGKHQYKSHCNFSCDDGYELDGTKSLFCQEMGQWSEPTPICLAGSCGDLQIPENGKMDCVDEHGKFQYKSFCIFSCNKGYILNGMTSLFCENTGEWSEPTPTCLAVQCVEPQIPDNGKINCTDNDGKHQYKSYCNFSCDDGYELNGAKSVFCQVTGQWSEPTPKCLAVSCGDLQIPANGKIDCVDEYGKFQYRSFCIFSCNKGYKLNGIKSLFCLNTGKWSELTPTCLATSCTDPQMPDNGKINCTDEHGKFQYKSFCNFSCNEGYKLNGTKSVFCLSNGEWSEPTPTCLAWNVSFGKQKQVTIVSSVLGTVGVSLPGVAIMYILKNLRKKKKESPLILQTSTDPSNTFANPAFEDKENGSSDL